MSCQIKGIARIVNPIDIRHRLVGDIDQRFDNVPDNELPLQNCLVSFSPAGDVLIVALNTRMVILASKWDSQEPSDVKNKFHVVWDDTVTKKPNEWITSILCLPIISNGKASGGIGTEWTYIAVGLNTGFVKFYTETGQLLFEEQFHNESIVNIKCQSHCFAKQAGDTGTSEEIYVLYNTLVCILQGFSLFSNLRAYRNYLAKVHANCDEEPPIVNLMCKKWGFKNQDLINDCEVIGSTSVNTFDHLMTVSICGGYSSSYRSSAPQHSLVIATGRKPFIGFHYAFEGASAPILSDVAIAMANKVVSALGAAVPWFKGSSKSVNSSEKLKGIIHEPSESMTCRFGVSDILREGYYIIVSPHKLLSVICDAMGRVILLDNIQGIVVRMWKGYRDAQCGWIEAVEEKNRTATKGNHSKSNTSNTSRNRKCKALFLAIYAPKKGIIDIWSIQNGMKITTFSASKNGRLLYINYGLCGLNDMIIKSGNQAQYPCIFIDSLGEMKEITVPFHFALRNHKSSQNSNSAKDTHLFKKLKKFLKEEDFDDVKLCNEITNVCLDLETNDFRLQMLEMLMINKHITPDALLAAVNCFSKHLQLKGDDSKSVTKALNEILKQLKQVVEFYKYVKAQFDQPPEYSAVTADNVPDDKQLSSVLFTSEQEVNRFLKLSKTIMSMKNSNSTVQNRVTFKEDGQTFLDFLSCFDFSSPGSLELQKNLNFDKKYQISKLIFQGWMYSNDPISKWRDCALRSNIQPRVLIQFALLYWLNKNIGTSLEAELINFTQLLNAICSLNDAEEICIDYNEVSCWWRDVRNILIDSMNPFNALTAAMACRAVSITMQKNKDGLQSILKDENVNAEDVENSANETKKIEKSDTKQENTSTEEVISNINDWESVSKDICQFSLLIGNLEDVAILNAIVSDPSILDETTKFHALPYEKNNISLGLVLSKGKGSVSEIVSKWLSSTGIDPTRLIDEENTELEQRNLLKNSKKPTESFDEIKAVQPLQEDIKKPLPFEIEIGSEAISLHTTEAKVLDRVSLLKRYFPYSLNSSILLANLSWEFVMAWSKDISRLESLEAALSIVRWIPFNRIRHGICCLLWNLHMKKKIESAGKLINKLGKLPKERLCIQDVGLSDIQLTSFLQHCVIFLETWLDAMDIEDESCCYINSEELWEGHAGGPQPLAIIAISQIPAQYDLLVLHWQLANTFYMMSYFNLKITKPIDNLFHSVAQRYLSQNISDKITIPCYKDHKRDNIRLEFLCRVITATIESINQGALDRNFNFTQATQWMSRCKDLASTWKINVDELRIHQVCQLYINGFDQLAEEASFFINNQEKLAENLLPIAGGRTMAYISKEPNLLQEVSRISPTLTTYLHKLDFPRTIFTNCSNKDRVELVKKVYRNLPEMHNEYHIAQQMLDATSNFEDETLLKSNQ